VIGHNTGSTREKIGAEVMSSQPAHDPLRTPSSPQPSTVDVPAPATPPDPARPAEAATLRVAPPGAGGGCRLPLDGVPGYELIEELGRGGMGVVYKARQQGLDRLVALKMILAGSHAGPADLARFHVEAQAVARLQHPNIVQVYEVGTYNGMPFLALEYCGGGCLSAAVAGKPIPAADAAAIVAQLARAVHHAHQHGIVHRDLKPGNVLLQELTAENAEGAEKTQSRDNGFLCAASASSAFSAVNFTPKITDFGLAKLLRREACEALTHTGEVMGTPSYMAPEQASGDTRHMGPACDIYGLGAILYELLTGRPPFLAATHLDTVLQVLNQEPLPPRMINRQLDADLDRVVLKCLAKEPQRRYANALELAEDLEHYLRGEPVSARSVNLLERLQRELAHSQHDAQLRPWGGALMTLAVVVFIAQLAVSLLLREGAPELAAYWVPRVIVLATLAVLWWQFRPTHSPWPANSVERSLWAVWIGYILTFTSLFWVTKLLGHHHVELYGQVTAASGLAWFVMGGLVWGGCYVIGLAFLALAPVLAEGAGSNWSPFWFGCLWTVALLVLGWRYWRLGRRAP
jgi:serine/threonine-protein kinase